MTTQTTLTEFADLARAEHGLVIVSTHRPDHTIQSSLVNAAVLDHPITGEPAVAFGTFAGRAKLALLRAHPFVTVTAHSGWQWVTVEGRATLFGPDDTESGLDADQVLQLQQKMFVAGGGKIEDWDEHRRSLPFPRPCAVIVTPTRCYTNPTAG